MKKMAEKYASIILKGIKTLPVSDVKELAKYVQFLYFNRAESNYEQLFGRAKSAAEKKGYSLKNINKLIKAVRSNS
ncbi:hypothetical protein HZB07_00945 [Candidatus Saganbacteria bacterium]|nr:hypothetical protein [Candidatus Saganbacteria bacterium]